MEQIVELGGHVAIALIVCSALFWGTSGYALSSFVGFNRVWGAVLSAVLPLIGVIVIAIVGLVRAERRRAQERSLTATAAGPREPDPHPAHEDGFGGSAFDSFDGSKATAVPSTSTSGDWGFGESGSDAAGFGESGASWDTAVDAIGGARTTPPLTPVRRRPPKPRVWFRERVAIIATVSGVLAVLLLLSTLVLPWFLVDTGLSPRYWVFAPGNGIDIVIYASAIAVAIGVIAFTRRPTRWAAIVIAWFADWWLLLVLIALSARSSVQELLEQLGAFRFTVGQMLQGVGAGPHAGVITLPPGVDLTSLGISSRTFDVGAIDLTAALKDFSLDLGASWWVLLGFVVIANVAVFVVIRESHRPVPDSAEATQ